MEIKSPKIKGIKYEDFKDNEYIDSLVAELNAAGANIVVGKLDQLMQWGHANSLWPFCFGTSCCAIEFMCLGAARYDMAHPVRATISCVKALSPIVWHQRWFASMSRWQSQSM